MLVISHRANINGPNSALYGENNPDSIKHALSLGYHVEVDVSYCNNRFYLGHSNLDYPIDLDFLKTKNLWIHCKNIEALHLLLQQDVICFFHDKDECTLTSNNYIWTYPSKYIPLTDKSIAVMPERVSGWNTIICFAVCTDFPKKYGV